MLKPTPQKHKQIQERYRAVAFSGKRRHVTN